MVFMQYAFVTRCLSKACGINLTNDLCCYLIFTKNIEATKKVKGLQQPISVRKDVQACYKPQQHLTKRSTIPLLRFEHHYQVFKTSVVAFLP